MAIEGKEILSVNLTFKTGVDSCVMDRGHGKL